MKNSPEYQLAWQRNNPEKTREYCRKWYRNNKSANNERIKKWRKDNPLYFLKNKEKLNARNLLRYHVNHGNIIKPKICQRCKKKCTPQGHHWNGYNRSLDVLWLCRECHSIAHRSLPYILSVS